MATECTQEAILGFLKDKGGKAKNTDLIEHFKAVFPEEPEKRAAVRERFKNHVDDVAFVKTESGVKYVCLKKKFRCSVKGVSNGTDPEPAHRYNPADSKRVRGNDAAAVAAPQSPAGGDVQQVTPASGFGSDKQVTFPHGLSPATILPDKTDDRSKCQKFVCVGEEVGSSSGEMGNRESFRKERKESKKERVGIPEISVIEASPLPAAGPVFTLPGPVQTGITGQVDTATSGHDPKDRQVETETVDGLKEAEPINVPTRRRNTRGSKHRSRQQQPNEGKDEGQVDEQSLSGSEGNITPIGSRKHFIKVMVSRSPQLRRSMVLRNSVHLSSRDDSDSVSLASSNQDDDGTPVALDPLEHEWMVCASDGEWGSMYGLLTQEPSLVLRKDFVTGFTCLHWAAKHGKPELIALIVNFAKQHDVPIGVDVRSNTGYTPLHIAAMHNHMEVVKLLVGAYNADVEIRDYSGRKACQYLTDNVSVDIRDIIGAYERCDSENTDPRDGGRWRFSKVLQSNLKPLRLLNPSNCDSVDGEAQHREKPLRRKSSLSRMKPKLQRLRARTSQIVHSTSFRDAEELEGSAKGSFKSRPKTHFFG